MQKIDAPKKINLVHEILFFLNAIDDILKPLPLSRAGWRRLNPDNPRGIYKNYYQAATRLRKAGDIKILNQNNQKFLVLTKKGALRVLLEKAKLPTRQAWDGKWRLIMYDIPVAFEQQRHFFRRLLSVNGFLKLQGSVFISPHPINREAVAYLKETGLLKFVRIVRIDEMDDDESIKKHFGLFVKK